MVRLKCDQHLISCDLVMTDSYYMINFRLCGMSKTVRMDIAGITIELVNKSLDEFVMLIANTILNENKEDNNGNQ